MRKWVVFVLGLTIILSGIPTASAQEARAEFTLDEIVVTAERRESSAQDTPVAVSAWDYNAIDEQNIGGIMDLQMRMPSTFISNDRVTIRGVGRSSTLLGTDPGVGIFIDGFYNPEPKEYMDDLFDVERIENVRGPQSTLYGKSTIGGAINIIERKPTREWSGQVKASIGNYESRRFQAAFGGPTPMENLFYRLVLTDTYYGGHTQSVVYDDEYIGTNDRWRAEAKLLYEPTDNLSIYLKYNVLDVNEREYETQIGSSWAVSQSPSIPTLKEDYSTFYSWIGEYGSGSYYFNPFYQYPGENPAISDPYKVAVNTLGMNGRDESTVDMTVTLTTGDFTTKFLTMYRDWDLLRTRDYDYGPNPDATKFQTADYNNEEYSFELQVQYAGQDSPISAIGGLYHYDHKESDIWNIKYYGDMFWELYYDYDPAAMGYSTTYTPPFSPRDDNMVYGLWQDFWEISQAAYLQVNYDIKDNLTISLGARYTEDKKKGSEERYYQMMWTTAEYFSRWVAGGKIDQATADSLVSKNPGPWISYDAQQAGVGHQTHYDDDGNLVVMAPGQYLHNGFPYAVETIIDDHHGNWAEWLWHMGLDWKPQESTLVYGKIDRGYKPGGFGLTAFREENFNSEFCNAYEIGWKQSWLDNRMNTQLGGFYYDYTDMQQTRLVGHDNIIDNASAANNYGIEFEGTGYIIENLLAGISYSYLIAEFDEYLGVHDQFEPTKLYGAQAFMQDGLSYQDLSGNEQAYSPEHKFTVQGTYTLPTDIGDFSLHALLFWQSEAYTSYFNTPERLMDSYSRVDADLHWNSPAYSWRVTLWVKNMSDEEIIRYQTLGGADQGFPDYKTYAAPRQFGIDISYKW